MKKKKQYITVEHLNDVIQISSAITSSERYESITKVITALCKDGSIWEKWDNENYWTCVNRVDNILISVEDRIYSLTHEQYKKFEDKISKIGIEGYNLETQEVLQWVEVNCSKVMNIAGSYNY